MIEVDWLKATDKATGKTRRFPVLEIFARSQELQNGEVITKVDKIGYAGRDGKFIVLHCRISEAEQRDAKRLVRVNLGEDEDRPIKQYDFAKVGSKDVERED